MTGGQGRASWSMGAKARDVPPRRSSGKTLDSIALVSLA
jgi:hypothetical protein